MSDYAVPESTIAFFRELERLIRRAESEVREIVNSKLELYCPDKALLAAVADKRQALADFIAEIVRNQVMEHDLAMLSGFDGSSQLADEATLIVRDQHGNEWPTYLHSEFMAYLADRGLQ